MSYRFNKDSNCYGLDVWLDMGSLLPEYRWKNKILKYDGSKISHNKEEIIMTCSLLAMIALGMLGGIGKAMRDTIAFE